MEKVYQHFLTLFLSGLFTCYALTGATQRNCSAIRGEEKVGCVLPDPKNPNGTVCLLLGCCWNPAEQNIRLKCFTKRGGTCMSYTGKVCQGSLTTTLGSYRNTPRFIDNRFGQLGTETFLQIGTNIINAFVNNDRKCRYIMYNMFCQYTLQPCYPDNTVVEYCKEDCEAIFRDCQEPLNQVIGAVKFYVQQNGLDFVHTGLPDCTRHKPAKYFDNLPNRTCIKTGFFGYTEPVTEPGWNFSKTKTRITEPATEPITGPNEIPIFPTSSFPADNNKPLIIIFLVVFGLFLL